MFLVGGSLLTAFGRRDAPSPASGQWSAIPDFGHKSLPPAGSGPANEYLNALWRVLKDAPTTNHTGFQMIENQLKQ